MKWDPIYSVEIPSIDNQHKKLIQMISDLNTAMSQGKGKDAVGGIINQLISYTKDHFQHEENLFKKHGYADTINHLKEHENFVKKVGDFKVGYESGKIMLTMEVMNFLKDWLRHHILEVDKKYMPFLKSKGAI